MIAIDALMLELVEILTRMSAIGDWTQCLGEDEESALLQRSAKKLSSEPQCLMQQKVLNAGQPFLSGR